MLDPPFISRLYIFSRQPIPSSQGQNPMANAAPCIQEIISSMVNWNAAWKFHSSKKNPDFEDSEFNFSIALWGSASCYHPLDIVLFTVFCWIIFDLSSSTITYYNQSPNLTARISPCRPSSGSTYSTHHGALCQSSLLQRFGPKILVRLGAYPFQMPISASFRTNISMSTSLIC